LRGRENGLIEVCLDAHVQSQGGEAHTAILAPGRYAVLAVSDNGCGMDEATKNAIFDPFFTTKALGNGTGLGLSLVEGIVRNHDGVVEVASALGAGALFRVYLPASEAWASKLEPADPRPRSSESGQSVLYVDDEKGLVLLANAMLTSLGYAPTVCTEPESALAMVKESPSRFAAVLTDLTMPGMTGIELAKAILRVRPEQAVVLISANLSDEEAERARELGVREVLRKPYNLGALSDVLARALAHHAKA